MLGQGFLLTVHNVDWDPRTGHHLASGVAPILKHGPDHLLWAIADDLIDGYFPFADRIGDAIDDVQDQVIRKATPDTVEQLFKLKRELIQVRRAISPVREVFNQLTNRDEKLIDPDEIVYFRDIYDHVIRLTDELDNYRELASATLDVYLTQVNNNLSVIMKRLTGVTVILAGIGAVAGIFGMSEAGTALNGGRGQRLLGRHRADRRPRRAWRPWSCAGSTGSDRAGSELALDGTREGRQGPRDVPRRVEQDVGRGPDVVGHAVRAGHRHGQSVEGAGVAVPRAGRRTRRRRCCRRRRPPRSQARARREAPRTPRACRPRSAAAGRRRDARDSAPGRAAATRGRPRRWPPRPRPARRLDPRPGGRGTRPTGPCARRTARPACRAPRARAWRAPRPAPATPRGRHGTWSGCGPGRRHAGTCRSAGRGHRGS